MFFNTEQSRIDVNIEYTTNGALARDGVDEDCDGVDGVDADGDGHASLWTGGDDCDDAAPASPTGCALPP